MPNFYTSKAKNVHIDIVVKFKSRRVNVITSKIVNKYSNPKSKIFFYGEISLSSILLESYLRCVVLTR